MAHDLLDDDFAEQHEINVTPFIDVMLVLLIIFMVAAPLSTVDLAVQLPSANAAATPQAEDPIYVTLHADMRVDLAGRPVGRAALAAALDVASEGDKTRAILVRGDRRVSYGALMDLLNTLRAAGYGQVGLTAIEDGAAR